MPCSTSFVWRNAVALAWLLAACGASQGGGSGRGAPAGSAAAQTAPGGQPSASMGGAGAGEPGIVRGAGGSGGTKASSGSSTQSVTAAGRGATGTAAPRSGSGGSAGATTAASAGQAGVAGAMSPQGKLYADDFEDGDLTKPSWIDGDPEQGAKWTVVAADGGKVLAQTASVSDWVFVAGGDYRWTDQVVEARVKITSEPGKAGIFARVRDTRNYYFLYIEGGSNLVLRKRIDNSSSDVQKVKVETTADTWYTLKLSVIGSQLHGYLDGKMLVSGSDNGVSSGGIGVGTADCTAQFDDISVNGS